MGNAIEIVSLSKRYRLGLTHGDLRETLAAGASRLVRRHRRPNPEEFWALRDIDLDVANGQALGIIGRNGAGKSTLLKILARITEPTTGVARMRGRVGALLEVGTGFHGELTGRENVFLNGAILGMPRREVAGRLDQIVDFAGIGQFLDTPVKRYSSGMFLRLAFAVAAHLDSEILVVDEVLAVGDAEFQRRCLGRMSEVESEGRTVVFVSHDLNAMASLCERVVWLQQGRIEADGPSASVIDGYLSSVRGRAWELQSPWVTESGVTLERFEVAGIADRKDASFTRAEPVRLSFRFRVERQRTPLEACLQIHDARGAILIEELLPVDPAGLPGVYKGTMELPPILNVGTYTASFWAGTRFDAYVLAEQALAFDVVGDDEGRPKPAIRVQPRWELHGPAGGVLSAPTDE